jgi:peroxiredoxin/uncharacterized membrane protein YphA (DoxX/SURF4 family)
MGVIVWVVRLLLVAVFAVAGIAKLADLKGGRKSMVEFGVPVFLSKPLAWLLPLAELACAGALIPRSTFLWGAGGLLGMLILFSAGMGISMARGHQPNCHCFGQLHATPIGWKTLVRNAILAAMAGFVLWEGPQNATADWSSLSALQTGLPAVAVGFGVLLVVQIWTMIHVLRQNGRLLVRIEALEAKVGKGHPQPQGLPQGTAAPEFSLKNLDDETVTLSSLTGGKPLLLIFAEPGCGACETLFPEIGKWQQEHAERLTLAIISRGKVEANRDRREKNRLQNILLQSDREVAKLYGCEGTPGAVVIREGKIASGLAVGPEAITTLMVHTLLPPRLKKGDVVPPYRLPDLDGQECDLGALRGRRTLLLFWSPTCGYCQGILNDLKTRERNPPKGTPDLLVISAGTVEMNRSQGLRSRVLLDQHFAAGTLFGAAGTPAAVLIDEEGRVASDVVAGASGAFEQMGFVPYVPTPDATVESMLKLAGVASTDTLYDLGCGDGRMVIAAAKNYGAHGVGVDIDPLRLAEARENAKKTGVKGLVRFEEGQLLEADIGSATVVTVYLLPEINRQVRSKLLSELKPGTRVVSHAYDMQEWKPDKEEVVDGNHIYLWTIPGKAEAASNQG